MAANNNEVCATGRRKCAVARVRMCPGTGKIVVNGRDVNEYFAVSSLPGYIMQVLKLVGKENKVDISANVCGGGVSGQAGAIRHGVARALLLVDENLRTALKSSGMLTRDARVKERKKPGQPGARRRFQFSKR